MECAPKVNLFNMCLSFSGMVELKLLEGKFSEGWKNQFSENAQYTSAIITDIILVFY
jgi:hypothetical protein